MCNALCLLRTYNMLSIMADFCATNVVYLYKTLVNAYSVKTYLLFERIESPYNRSDVHLGSASSALPLWYYREDTRTFNEWSLEYTENKRSEIPILSMAITDGERILHDLTEYMESVRVFHSTGAIPSIAHILGAWSLSSGIVLNPSNNYFVTVITSTADTLTFPMTSTRYLNLAIAPEPEAEAEATPEIQST